MKRPIRALIIALLVAASLWLGGSLLALLVSVRLGLQAKTEALVIIQDVKERRFDTLPIRLPVVQDRLTRAEFWRKPSGWLAILPVVGDTYALYRDGISASRQAADAGLQFISQLSQDGGFSGLADLDFSQVGYAYLTVHEDVQQALQEFLKVADDAQDIDTAMIPQDLRADIASLQQLSLQMKAFLDPFLPVIEDLPVLLGRDEPQDILLLLENPDELRPTGGFIGTFGRVTIDKGRITQFFTDDIYRLPDTQSEPAPEPFQKYANLTYWQIRDANWSPDFPTSARAVLRLYGRSTGKDDVDMVLAMTPRLVEEFLRQTGPITVDHITFTAENLVDALQYRVEQEFWRIGIKDEDRKKVINDLAHELRARFFALNADQTRLFAETARKTIDEKEILLYSTNPAVQQQFVEAGWAGVVPKLDNDMVAVVDANIGALKTDRLVDRTIDYTLTKRQDGRYQATLSLTYRNRATTFDYRTTRYRTYTRVYVPLGSTLIKADGLMAGDKQPANAPASVYAELEKTVFAGFVSIEPGQQRTVTYTYTLPDWLEQHIERTGRYDLTVLKQPGTHPVFRGSFTADKPLRSFAPSSTPYQTIGKTGLSFTQPLTADQTFSILFSSPQ